MMSSLTVSGDGGTGMLEGTANGDGELEGTEH